MSARSAFSAAVVLALMAAIPARAQEPSPVPEHQDAPPAQVVGRSGGERRERADGGGVSVRAPRVSDDSGAQEVRPRVRPALESPAPSTPVLDEEQGGRRRSGSGSGGATRGGGAGGSGGRTAGGNGGVRPRGGVRAPGGTSGGNGTSEAGQAVPRGRVSRPSSGGYSPSYSRRYYAGSGGLGYYYYDPWSWYGGYGPYGAAGYGWGGYYGNQWGGYYGGGYGGSYGAYGGPYGWSVGGVRLKVDPKDAEVYVDGYYAGIVDDFDGLWQQLRLDDGGYHIEVRKPGMTTLTFDVRVQPGRTITYRGRMTP